MAWGMFSLEWLARSAAGGFVILGAAAIAVRVCHQPLDRIRVTSLALLGAVLVPLVALLPGLPRWSVEVLPPEPAAVTAAATQVGGTAPDSGPGYRPTPEPRPQPIQIDLNEPRKPPAPATAPDAPVGDLVPAAAAAAAPLRSWSVERAVLVTYGALTALFVVRSLLGLWRLFALMRSARPAPPEAISLLRSIAGPGAERVCLLVSESVDSPVALAGFQPMIVLPASASDHESLAYCLAHEWSHIERGDVWRWYLVALAQIVLFYQPLFWWLRRQLRLSQDYVADARAAAQAAEPADYAHYLVTLARRRLAVPALALGITDRRSNLARRVHMLLLNHIPLSQHCRRAWTVGTAAVAVALVAALSAIHLTAAPAVTEEPKADAAKPADPPKGEKLSYTGRVTDKDTGKAIAGVVVTVRRSVLGDPEQKERNPVIEETKHTTDAEGKYSFVIPPEQTSKRYLYIELDVEHPDYAPQKGFGYALSMILKNEKHGGRPFFESVEMRPAQPVTGVVQTPDGKPAAGVRVLAYSVTSKRKEGVFEYGSFADTRTGPDGKFRLPLTTPGWAVMWVLPEDFIPRTHVLKDKRGDLGTFTLQDGPRMRGVVLGARGKPLAGVIVNAESRERNGEITEPVADNIDRSAVTNEKGEFVMNPLPPGNYLVKPGDYARDGSLDRMNRKAGEVPGVFIGTKVTLKAGAEPDLVEVKAVPHVTIEAQYYDSKGKPTRGHAPHVFGQIDGVYWFAEAKTDPNGKIVVDVPHGLEQVQLNLMTNEHGSLRWRKKKGEPLSNNRTIALGTVTDVVRGIEIVRYTAPILVVKVATKDGSKAVRPAVTAVYAKGKGQYQGRLILPNGRQSDVSFEKQEDGRFRSEQMFPDEEVTVTGHADGYASKSEKVKLEEGTTKEIEIELEKGEGKK